jgi:hypothetical protein
MTENFNILYTNLKLLDFDKFHQKDFSNLNPQSFNKSNSNLMCVIIYFLFTREDESFKEIFSLCYPVTTLKELKDFKELAFIHIKNLLEKDKNSNSSEYFISKTVLDTGYGEKLIYFLRLLSDKIIQNEIKKMKNTKNELNFENDFYPVKTFSSKDNTNSALINFYKSQKFLEIKKKSILIKIIESKSKLIENSKIFNSIQNKWKNFASDLTNELQVLEKEKVSLQKSLKNLKNTQIDFSIFNELASLDRAPKLENHKIFLQLVNQLKENLEEKSEFINNLDYINQNENNIYE